MHTLPEDVVDNDHNYRLFVRLPTARTITLRNLWKQVSVSEIRERLEIQAGLPSQLYEISLAGGQIMADSAKFTFGQQLRNGAILRTSLHSHLELLFNTVKENVSDADTFYSLIVGKDVKCPKKRALQSAEDRWRHHGDEQEEFSNAERCFLMLFLASHFGHHNVCKLLLTLDPEGPHRVTCFGRTALHAAAANDQLNVVQLLLHAGAPLSPRDAFGRTPLEYCREYGACTCERALKYKVLTGGKDPDDQPQEEQHRDGRRAARKKSAKTDDKKRIHIRVKGAKDELEQQAIKVTARSALGATQECVIKDSKKVHWSSSQALNAGVKESGVSAVLSSVQQQSEPVVESSLREVCHSDCYKRPSFVAMRRVPLEDQKLVTVEFTPMERPKTAQSSVVSRHGTAEPKAGDKHAWAEKVVRSKVEGHDGGVKGRTQSAQYYKTKYHPQAADTEYRERPATAGPRFRFWKTWLLEKLEQEAIKDKMSKEDTERRKRNMAAYKRWLGEKEREDARQEKEESSASSDEEENLGYGNWPSPREMAFKKWLESKRSMIVQMTRRKQQEEERARNGDTVTPHKDIYDRRLTVFEIGCTDPTPIRQPSPEKYIGSYKTWLAKKKRFEAWKAKNNVQLVGEEESTTGDLEAQRYALFMEGMTYEEWLGMKHRQSKLDK